ncbi:MAG: hypothetical protein ACXWT1_05435 [Methylobacter sp.]
MINYWAKKKGFVFIVKAPEHDYVVVRYSAEAPVDCFATKQTDPDSSVYFVDGIENALNIFKKIAETFTWLTPCGDMLVGRHDDMEKFYQVCCFIAVKRSDLGHNDTWKMWFAEEFVNKDEPNPLEHIA